MRMEWLYYSKQWPGTRSQQIRRFFYVLYLEFRRVLTGKIYIAEFDLSDECNLHCEHCYHFRYKDLQVTPPKSVTEWEQKFRELHKTGIRRILLIGGEPALRQDVIRVANSIFRYIDICSNGTIRIETYYTQKIFVSLDGKKEFHDSIRGNGIFDKVLENYRNDPRVVLSMTINDRNWQQIEYVIKLAIENHMLGVSCDIYTPSPDHNDADKLFLLPNDRKKVIAEFWRLKKAYPNNFLMSKSAIRWFEQPNHGGGKCYWHQEVLHFNTQLEERISCKDLDCRNCGHFAQANLSPLNFLVFRKRG